MFGLEFSISVSSLRRLVKIMEEHDVDMLSTSVGTLAIWGMSQSGAPAKRYNMQDIIADENVTRVLCKENHHQLEDYVRAILERVDELDERNKSMR